jgi:hypothetical protein
VIAALFRLNGLDRDVAFEVVDRAVSSGTFSDAASDAWFKGSSDGQSHAFADAFDAWLRCETSPIESDDDATKIILTYALQCFVDDPRCREAALACVTSAQCAYPKDDQGIWICYDLYFYNENYVQVALAGFDAERETGEFAQLDAKALELTNRWLRENQMNNE